MPTPPLKYDRFGSFGHIIPCFFLVCKRCWEKNANQKECSVSERDAGIPVTGNRCCRGKRNYIVKGHQSEAFKCCVLIPFLFHIARMDWLQKKAGINTTWTTYDICNNLPVERSAQRSTTWPMYRDGDSYEPPSLYMITAQGHSSSLQTSSKNLML